jgi:hypothetical protein
MQNGTIEIYKVAEVCQKTKSVKEKGRSKTIILGENDIQDIGVEIDGALVYICIQKGRVSVWVYDGTVGYKDCKGELHINTDDGLAIDAKVDRERLHFSRY